jgi:hypothetical protein
MIISADSTKQFHFFVLRLYNDDRWINEYGKLANVTYRGKRKHSQRNLFWYHFVQHKSHTALFGIEAMSSMWEVGDCVSHGMTKQLVFTTTTKCVFFV